VYLLDTNILSEIAKSRPNSSVLARFRATADEQMFTSAVCIEEIHFGIRAGPHSELVRARMATKVLHRVTVLDFDEATAKVAGEMRGEWKLRGAPVGYRDGLIAATAKAHGLTLETRNSKRFDTLRA
jgi:predicted nucleic acid-binding protein